MDRERGEVIFGPHLARLIFAVCTSITLTSTVVGPMAYQAYSARVERHVTEFIHPVPPHDALPAGGDSTSSTTLHPSSQLPTTTTSTTSTTTTTRPGDEIPGGSNNPATPQDTVSVMPNTEERSDLPG